MVKISVICLILRFTCHIREENRSKTVLFLTFFLSSKKSRTEVRFYPELGRFSRVYRNFPLTSRNRISVFQILLQNKRKTKFRKSLSAPKIFRMVGFFIFLHRMESENGNPFPARKREVPVYIRTGLIPLRYCEIRPRHSVFY